jgi:hypothetical protein
MIRLTINREVNIRWLTRELQVAGVDVTSVELGAPGEAYALVAEADEAAALAVIGAHDPANTPDVAERSDFNDLDGDITNQVEWINTTIPEIDTGLGLIDSAFPNATQRAIIRGLLQNQRRILLVLRGLLRAFRFVVRRLK